MYTVHVLRALSHLQAQMMQSWSTLSKVPRLWHHLWQLELLCPAQVLKSLTTYMYQCIQHSRNVEHCNIHSVHVIGWYTRKLVEYGKGESFSQARFLAWITIKPLKKLCICNADVHSCLLECACTGMWYMVCTHKYMPTVICLIEYRYQH